MNALALTASGTGRAALAETGWPATLVVLSARNPGELAQRAAELANQLEREPARPLVEIGAALARDPRESRLAVVASDARDLARKARHASRLLADPQRERIQDRSGVYWFARPLAAQGGLAFVFPGEGAQYPHMLRSVLNQFPEARREFEMAQSALARSRPSPKLEEVVFPLNEEATGAARLHDLEFAVISVLAAQRALLSILRRLGVTPEAVVGHSSGEFGALVCAGACPADDAADAQQMLAACAANASQLEQSGLVPPAVLLAVGAASLSLVHEVVAGSDGRLVVAMDNCPHQVVLAGDEASAEAAQAALRRRGAVCEVLPFRRAYHTAAFRPATGIVEKFIRGLRLTEYDVPIWSCATARPMPNNRAAIEELAIRQWHLPVRFRETVEAMYAAGARVFVEVGPKGNLCSFIADTLGRRPHAAVPLDLPSRDGLLQLCHAAGLLAAHHVPMRLEALYEAHRGRDTGMSGAGGKPSSPGGRAAPAARPPAATARGSVGQAARPFGDGGARAAMIELQRTLRAFLKVQQAAAQVLARRSTRAATSAGAKHPPGAGEPRAAAPQAKAVGGHQHALPPFIDRIVARDARQLTAECRLDVARHGCLRDHAFFGRGLAATDAAHDALIVVPMALSLEILAEAAALLCPGLRASAVRDARTRQWLIVERGGRLVHVGARRLNQRAVHARLYDAGNPGDVFVEAAIEFDQGPARLGPPSLIEPALPAFARPQSDVYGPVLFSGPAFQTIRRMETCGPAGARATLQETPAEAFAGSGATQGLVLPVSLIDSCGQIGIFSLAEATWTRDEITMTFPNVVERIEFAQRDQRIGPLSAVTTLDWNDRRVHSAVEMRSTAGDVVFRALGRVEEIVRLPGALWRYQAAPRAIELNRSLAPLFADEPELAGVAIMFTAPFSRQLLVHRVWSQVFASMILGAAERQAFQARSLAPVPAALWLLGRSAVKDAVRQLTGCNLCMADIAIGNDPSGQPRAALGQDAPCVSIAHKPFAAAAAAASAARNLGVGVDLEPCTPPAMRACAAGLSPQENRLAEGEGGGELANELRLALWTAKEAAAKALGGAVPFLGRRLNAARIDPARGMVELHLELAGETPFGGHAGQRVVHAFWRRVDGFLVTVCLARW